MKLMELDFSNRNILMVSFLAAGLIIGGATTYLYMTSDQIGQEEAANKIIETVEQQSGQSLELVNTEAESGLYKVDLRTQDDTLSTFHVTKDGRMFSNAMQDLDEIRDVLNAQKEFYSCLADNNTVMYGNMSEQETVLQVQLMGGGNQLGDIYRDVNDEENLQEARDRGIETVPAFYLGGNTLEGVQQMEQIEEFTGCSLDIE